MKMKYWFGISMVILGIVCVIIGRTEDVQVQVGQVWEDDFRTGNPFDGFTSTRRRILAVRDGYAQYEVIGDRYKTIHVMMLSRIKTAAYLYEGVCEEPNEVEAIALKTRSFDQRAVSSIPDGMCKIAQFVSNGKISWVNSEHFTVSDGFEVQEFEKREDPYSYFVMVDNKTDMAKLKRDIRLTVVRKSNAEARKVGAIIGDVPTVPTVVAERQSYR